MDLANFSSKPNNECKASKVRPDSKAIQAIVDSAKKRHLAGNTVIIGRYQWLKRHRFDFPMEMELPNLCVTIKKGKLIRAFYSNVLSHVIKKQNYYIQILN